MIEVQHLATGKPVVVVPVLISTGRVSREKLPRDLSGLPIVYSGDALLPHPAMAQWWRPGSTLVGIRPPNRASRRGELAQAIDHGSGRAIGSKVGPRPCEHGLRILE